MTQESELKRKLRRGTVQDAVLSAVAVAGILAVAAIAPNTLTLLGKALNKQRSYRTRSSTKRLIDDGLIEFVTRNGTRFVQLTKAGEKYVGRKSTYRITQPKRWDGKWRIVSFDIAQARSAKRALLRHTLQEIGFERLQDSVWVFPYDCEDLISLLKADYGLGKEVLYIIADSIENDRGLRGRFGLGAR